MQARNSQYGTSQPRVRARPAHRTVRSRSALGTIPNSLSPSGVEPRHAAPSAEKPTEQLGGAKLDSADAEQDGATEETT